MGYGFEILGSEMLVWPNNKFGSIQGVRIELLWRLDTSGFGYWVVRYWFGPIINSALSRAEDRVAMEA